jgi:hypothetical protein
MRNASARVPIAPVYGCPKEGSMGILSWILLGLVVGALAKWLMPGTTRADSS